MDNASDPSPNVLLTCVRHVQVGAQLQRHAGGATAARPRTRRVRQDLAIHGAEGADERLRDALPLPAPAAAAMTDHDRRR